MMTSASVSKQASGMCDGAFRSLVCCIQLMFVTGVTRYTTINDHYAIPYNNPASSAETQQRQHGDALEAIVQYTAARGW